MDGTVSTAQAQKSDRMTARHVLKLAGAAVLFLIVNVGVSILMVAVYAYLINPGHPPEFYEDFATVYAPYSSIFAGMPLLFGLCWWMSRGHHLSFARKSALGIWLIYTIIDLIVVFASGMTPRLAVLVTISTVTKLAAAWFGAQVGAVADRTK